MTINKLYSLPIMLVICILTSLALPAGSYSAQIPTTVVEVFHDMERIMALEPEVANTEVSLVPLRSMLEPHGIIVKYNSSNESRRDTTTFTLSIGSNNIGSKRVSLNRGSRTSGRLFFLEYPPRIINGQTMVPSNFIQEVLDAVQNREQHLEKIAASDYPSDENSMANKRGYKYYCLMLGPETGPNFDQAVLYVTEHKLLHSVTGTEETPNGFEEFGSKSTMVMGKDKQGLEKAVWLNQNGYTEEISTIAWIYLDEIISKEVIYNKMQIRGITEKDIKRIHLAPYSPGKVLWFVEAEKNNIIYYIAFDCLNGEVYLKRSSEHR